ncbi:DUF1758 domain-containing protein [Trichonephila clavipes]|nr:DUF1758 domain-containing protein [Trichonephila clavipes]
MDNVSEHVDITELEVKLKKIDQLQRKIEKLKELLFGLETAKPTEEVEFEEDLYKCETRLADLEVRVKKLIKSINASLSVTAVEKSKYENGTFAQTKIQPIILPTFSGKYEQFSNFKSQFDDLITTNEQLTQSQKLYYLNSCLSNEVKEFASTFDTFSSLIIKDNVYKVNKELFRETEFGWIAGGRLQGTKTNNFSCYLLKDNDSVEDTLKLCFFELEYLGIKDDPCYRKDDQAIKKEGRVTTYTRIVFYAASHQANELSLNDCVWPGTNFNTNLLDVLINFRLNRVAISSDIRQRLFFKFAWRINIKILYGFYGQIVLHVLGKSSLCKFIDLTG